MKTIWATMVTPFQQDGSIDYQGLKAVVEWYISKGIDGLFAVCQSSEMFHLSLQERVKVAATVVDVAKGRVPVVASGHISDSASMQLEELTAIHNTGVEAVVLVTNRLAEENQGDDVFKSNLERLFNALPTCTFGLYECPYPYKRLLSDELLAYCAKSGRISFFKDTCCDINMLAKRIGIIKSSNIKLLNANTATLRASLKLGADGFCGIMTNFHPELYTFIARNYQTPEAQLAQEFATVAGNVYYRGYPSNAKYYMKLDGVPIEHYSRINNDIFTPLIADETKQLHHLWSSLDKMWGDRFENNQ